MLNVYDADGEEFVIAETPEDAPTTWEQRAAESAFSYHDDGTGKTTTKACGEWAAERGRGYFASANY